MNPRGTRSCIYSNALAMAHLKAILCGRFAQFTQVSLVEILASSFVVFLSHVHWTRIIADQQWHGGLFLFKVTMPSLCSQRMLKEKKIIRSRNRKRGGGGFIVVESVKELHRSFSQFESLQLR